ncbi:hypothetical protein PG994_004909 [Apiospora phragmitis]|uniref:Uncharacterized protein n=1 Tax=Apiospora phragmitis TaxID=2905665 RepID=A0ABR1VRX3_9PEZI
MKKTKVTLGIDLGSTSTRAVLGPQHVEETNRNFQSQRFSPGDFSSSIYPFENEGLVYLSEQPDPTRKPVSAKYAFYTLVNAKDELLEQYPLAEELTWRKDDEPFRQRLRTGLEQLFAETEWNLDFEELYRSIIVDVFGSQYKNDIIFVYETEALGQFLCRDYSGYLLHPEDTTQDEVSEDENSEGEEAPPKAYVRHDALLFLDFGGHSMNTCTFNVVYDQNDKPSFYLISSAKGACGGSEQWEYDIAQKAVERLEKKKGRQMPPLVKQEILDDFNRGKAKLGPTFDGRDYLFKGSLENGESMLMPFTPETLAKYFDAALKRPLELARERIEELINIKDIRPRVVVSGGTSRHAGLQHKLSMMCKENGLSPPFFTDTLSIKYDSMKIALGTVYAASNRTTIEQFLGRGAAIGVQRQPRAPRDPNTEDKWEYVAEFLLSNTRREIWKSKVTGSDRLKLICHPFYEAQSQQGWLEHYRCYDLLELGQPLKGSWRLALSFTGSGNDTQLLMERHYKPFKSKRYRRFDTRFPLYYNRGENCIHFGVEGGGNEELLEAPGRYPRAEGNKGTAIPTATREADLEGEMGEVEQDGEEEGNDKEEGEYDELVNEHEEEGTSSEESLESAAGLIEEYDHLCRNLEEVRRLDQEFADFDFTAGLLRNPTVTIVL